LTDGDVSPNVKRLARRVQHYGLNTSEVAVFSWNEGTTNSKRISGTFTHSCWKPWGPGGGGEILSQCFEMSSIYSAGATQLGAWGNVIFFRIKTGGRKLRISSRIERKSRFM
jgi:hypothetical protein